MKGAICAVRVGAADGDAATTYLYDRCCADPAVAAAAHDAARLLHPDAVSAGVAVWCSGCSRGQLRADWQPLQPGFELHRRLARHFAALAARHTARADALCL